MSIGDAVATAHLPLSVVTGGLGKDSSIIGVAEDQRPLSIPFVAKPVVKKFGYISLWVFRCLGSFARGGPRCGHAPRLALLDDKLQLST